MVIDSSTTESTTVEPMEDATGKYAAVSLKSKKDAAAKFSALTAKNIGIRLRIKH